MWTVAGHVKYSNTIVTSLQPIRVEAEERQSIGGVFGLGRYLCCDEDEEVSYKLYEASSLASTILSNCLSCIKQNDRKPV